MSKRHKKCLQQVPQASPYGASNYPWTGLQSSTYGNWIEDFKAPENGWYTLRVRAIINTCFRGMCEPKAGPFDIMAKVTPTAQTTMATPTLGSAKASDSRASLVAGGSLTITSECPSANGMTMCWSRADVGRQPGDCEDTFKHYDGDSPGCARPYYETRSEATFNGAKDDVVCLSAQAATASTTRPADKLELWFKAGGTLKLVATALNGLITAAGEKLVTSSTSTEGGIDGMKGLAISGFTLPQAGEYVVRASSKETSVITTWDSSLDPPKLQGTSITLDKNSAACRARKKDIALDGVPPGCEKRKMEAGWDYCRMPRDVTFSNDKTTASFTGQYATNLTGKVGVNLTKLADATAVPQTKFYWEITIGGNRGGFDRYGRQYVDLSGAGKTISVGIATSFMGNGGTGSGGSTTEYLGSTMEGMAHQNQYDKGAFHVGGPAGIGGFVAYGEMLLPGDVVSVAF